MPNSQVGLHALHRAGIIVSGNDGKDEAFSAADVINGFTLWQVQEKWNTVTDGDRQVERQDVETTCVELSRSQILDAARKLAS